MNIKDTFITLLRSQVSGRKLEFSLELFEDYDNLMHIYEVSKYHDVAPIVAYALEGVQLFEDNASVSDKFSNELFKAVYRGNLFTSELSSLRAALEEEKIPFIPLKGAVMRRLYPEAWMRTSSDIDVLVHEDDLECAINALSQRLGYKFKERAYHDVSLYSPSGVHIELHFSLESLSVPEAAAPLKRVWSYASPIGEGKAEHYLSDEMFYYYHISHMAMHFIGGGCGIRPFLDLLFLERMADGNPELVQKRNSLLSEGTLLSFAEGARALCRVWFFADSHSEMTKAMEEYIFRGGVYGSLENSAAVKSMKQGSRLSYVLSRIFLPYDTLKLRYPILKKHKILTPLYQVRRWFSLLSAKRLKRSRGELRAARSVSDAAIEDARALLDKLGLSE